MANNIQHLKSVMADRAFVEKIISMENPIEVQKAFSEKNIHLTIEQINEIAELVFNANGDELSDQELENVGGGLLAEIAIVASGIALVANIMTEVNNSRKSKGKSTIW